MPSPIHPFDAHATEMVDLRTHTHTSKLDTASSYTHPATLCSPSTSFSPPPKTSSLTLSSSRRPSRVFTPLPLSHLSTSSTSRTASPFAGYTVIDIHSLPPSRSTSPPLSPSPPSPPPPPPLHSPPSNPRALRVDAAQLLAAAEEEDVSPRTALFLAMKAKAKGERRGRKKGKGGGGGEGGGGEGGAVKELSRSLELSSLSSSRSRGEGVGGDRGGEGVVDGERRLKAKREKKLGYKLCKVSGCLEVRAKEGHKKYCSAHQGIHVQGNPNERRGQQRGNLSARP